MGKTKANTKGGKKGSDDEAYVATKKKATKEKDPNMPKKATCAYFLFMKERRVTLRKEEPNLQMGPATKKMTDEWKALTDKEKEKFNKLAEEDKLRYQKEMAAIGKPVKSAIKKGETADGKPEIKKAQSSYFLFQAEERAKLKKSRPELQQKEIMKEMGASWKRLTDKQKKVWEDKAIQDKKRYEREMKEAAQGKKAEASKADTKKKGVKDTETKESDDDEEGEGEDDAEDQEGEDGSNENEQDESEEASQEETTAKTASKKQTKKAAVAKNKQESEQDEDEDEESGEAEDNQDED